MLAAALAAASAHASVTEFRLPPSPSPQQQPPPDRQGPVAPDVPASRRLVPTPTPTPAPTAAAPTPAITPPAVIVPQVRPTAARPLPVQTTAPTIGTSPAPAAPTEAGAARAAPATGLGFPAETASPSAPAAQSAAFAEPAEQGGVPWLWVLGGVAALGALGFAGWKWRRRKTPTEREAPRVERPRVVPAPEPTAPAFSRPPGATAPEPLQIALEPLRLSLTLMNATLAYRLRVANGGMTALIGLTIGADMISAHASLSREEQLAGPIDATAGQRIERLEPGESRVVEGEFRLPFQQIVPIRQGRAALLLPLARFRVEAEGAAPVVRTFIVGQPGASERLQPFRLDLGPRIYPNLAQHAFA